jgi:hypothetical protein
VIDIDPVEIETVAGMLLPNASLTISCATYVPATSGTKLANAPYTPLREALLPAGPLRDHRYPVIGSLSGSYDEAALSNATDPTATLGVLVVGTATGGVTVLVMVTNDGAL